MREGSLEAPIRHAIPWQEETFTDPEVLDVELRRVFGICHGCRRCFNLCNSFPKLFDLIDQSNTGEPDAVNSTQFKQVVDACTLCDMCFMTKCPYVPPHEFNLDFPHLMLRYRAMEFGQGKVANVQRQLTETDRNGKLGSIIAPLANWFSDRSHKTTRSLLEMLVGIHRDAELPKYHRKTFQRRHSTERDENTLGGGRKAILYATCFVNFNNPEIGVAAQKVLVKNGVETETVYPLCCGMPKLEQGNIGLVADNAKKVAAHLLPWVNKGYDVIALVPSCALMLKFEWPLILPEDDTIKKLSNATFDISEYIVDIAKREGLRRGLKKIDRGVTIHLACHSRAQNMGPKAAEMLRLIPDTEVKVVERCSGHGGSWGIMKENFETALKVGRAAARMASETGHKIVVSECPLARDHIVQGMEILTDTKRAPDVISLEHPIQVFAMAYGIE